jgi:hypothetical protein
MMVIGGGAARVPGRVPQLLAGGVLWLMIPAAGDGEFPVDTPSTTQTNSFAGPTS